jgi:hypothetical protein
MVRIKANASSETLAISKNGVFVWSLGETRLAIVQRFNALFLGSKK